MLYAILSHYKDDSYKTMIDHFDVEQYNVINVEFWTESDVTKPD